MDAQITQLLEARSNCKKSIEAMQAASLRDKVDRGNSIASLTRDLGSFEAQLKSRGYKDPVAEPLPEKPKSKSK